MRMGRDQEQMKKDPCIMTLTVDHKASTKMNARHARHVSRRFREVGKT